MTESGFVLWVCWGCSVCVQDDLALLKRLGYVDQTLVAAAAEAERQVALGVVQQFFGATFEQYVISIVAIVGFCTDALISFKKLW